MWRFLTQQRPSIDQSLRDGGNQSYQPKHWSVIEFSYTLHLDWDKTYCCQVTVHDTLFVRVTVHDTLFVRVTVHDNLFVRVH
jgi:hypothetical protein